MFYLVGELHVDLGFVVETFLQLDPSFPDGSATAAQIIEYRQVGINASTHTSSYILLLQWA